MLIRRVFPPEELGDERGLVRAHANGVHSDAFIADDDSGHGVGLQPPIPVALLASHRTNVDGTIRFVDDDPDRRAMDATFWPILSLDPDRVRTRKAKQQRCRKTKTR
jgi:hypothetical protein